MTSMTSWKHRGILSAEDNAVPETTVDATWRQIEAFTVKGIENGVIVDAVDGDIEITADGDYAVHAGLSFTGSLGKTFYLQIYKNAAGTGFEVERKIGTGGDVGAAPLMGLVSCVAGDKLSLWQKSPDGATTMTITHGQFMGIREG